MEFADPEELEQFVQIALMLEYYKARGRPIPEEVRALIEQSRDECEACHVLNDMIND